MRAAWCDNIIEIIKGSDRVLPNLRVVFSDTRTPLDLTGATEIKALFPKEDGTMLAKTLTGGAVSVVSAVGGVFTVTLGDADTSVLRVGDRQSFEVEVVVGATTTIVQFRGVLNVRPRLTC